MAETEPIRVATLRVGYGKLHFAQSITEHADAQGVRVESVDLLPMLGWLEQTTTRAGYRALSLLPWANRLVRGLYGNKPKSRLDRDKLEQIFPVGSTIISVSPIALSMLEPLHKRHIVHMVADRKVEAGDLLPGASRVAIPGVEIDGHDAVDTPRRVYTQGFPQPYGFAKARYTTLHEQRASLESGKVPNVLYSVHGAGGWNFGEVIKDIAQMLKKNAINLTVFAGHRDITQGYIESVLRKNAIPFYFNDETPSGGQENNVHVVTARDSISAVRKRMELLPKASVVIPASPTEMTNGPYVVVLDSTTCRNDREMANVGRALAHGWAIDARGDWQGALSSLTQKPIDSQATRGAELLSNAWRYNNPLAATNLINLAKAG